MSPYKNVYKRKCLITKMSTKEKVYKGVLGCL